jgi:hypothetical protein
LGKHPSRRQTDDSVAVPTRTKRIAFEEAAREQRSAVASLASTGNHLDGYRDRLQEVGPLAANHSALAGLDKNFEQMQRVMSLAANHSALAGLDKNFEQMQRVMSLTANHSALAGLDKNFEQMQRVMSLANEPSTIAQFGRMWDQSRTSLGDLTEPGAAIAKMAVSLTAAGAFSGRNLDLINQSLALATQPPSGESFLAQAIHLVEVSEIPEENDDVAAILDAIFTSLFKLFQDAVANIRSVFETQALVNALVLVLMAATFYVNLEQRDIAREALKFSRQSSNIDAQGREMTKSVEFARARKDEALEGVLTLLESKFRAHEVDAPLPPLARYTVKRYIPLMASPKMRSERVIFLYPGQVVELIDAARKWINIRYYDYATDRVISGWVVKKYLKRQR